MKGFAFPKRFKSAASLLPTLTRNNRELSNFLNSFVVRFNGDGSTLTLPSDVSVAGDLTVSGEIVTDDWTAASLLNSWVNFNAGANRTAAYLKTSDGTVHVKGIVKSGTSDSAIILTLPTALRPLLILNLAQMTNAGIGLIHIATDGSLSYTSGGSTTWSLIECSFQI